MDLDAEETLLDYIPRDRYTLLPNTADCFTAREAIRTAHLAREAGLSNWIKLEVIGDRKTLYPDNEELLIATRELVGDGFVVLPYTSDDVVVAQKLEQAGAAAVMPLGAPIGSGLGIQNRNNIAFIREAVSVPVIVDAGVGTASDVTVAMELGADGVLLNTAVAAARNPGEDGGGDEARRRSRAALLARGPHAPPPLRHRVLAAGGRAARLVAPTSRTKVRTAAERADAPTARLRRGPSGGARDGSSGCSRRSTTRPSARSCTTPPSSC